MKKKKWPEKMCEADTQAGGKCYMRSGFMEEHSLQERSSRLGKSGKMGSCCPGLWGQSVLQVLVNRLKVDLQIFTFFSTWLPLIYTIKLVDFFKWLPRGFKNTKIFVSQWHYIRNLNFENKIIYLKNNDLTMQKIVITHFSLEWEIFGNLPLTSWGPAVSKGQK